MTEAEIIFFPWQQLQVPALNGTYIPYIQLPMEPRLPHWTAPTRKQEPLTLPPHCTMQQRAKGMRVGFAQWTNGTTTSGLIGTNLHHIGIHVCDYPPTEQDSAEVGVLSLSSLAVRQSRNPYVYGYPVQ